MASGEKSEVAETIAQREIAPTVLSPPTNGAVSPPPAPPAPKVVESNNNKRYSKVRFRKYREVACILALDNLFPGISISLVFNYSLIMSVYIIHYMYYEILITETLNLILHNTFYI